MCIIRCVASRFSTWGSFFAIKREFTAKVFLPFLKHRLFLFFEKVDVLNFLSFFFKMKFVTAVTIMVPTLVILCFVYGNIIKTLKKEHFFLNQI